MIMQSLSIVKDLRSFSRAIDIILSHTLNCLIGTETPGGEVNS